MYDFSEYRELTSVIRDANSSRLLRSALHGFLNEAAMTWWNGLEDNERKAIILLDFDASVVTTMVFFGRDWGFGGSYGDVLELILDKAELLAQEKDADSWDYELRCIIDCARQQKQYEEDARHKAAEIVRELGMETGVNALEELLVNNSGLVRANKKRKEAYAKEMRKAILGDALIYLQKHYKDSDSNEEEGDE